jgi:hypothetical protein
MATKVDLWTPVKYRNLPISLGQHIVQWVDSYLCLDNQVAVVIPGALENKSTGCWVMDEGEVSFLKITLKVGSYCAVVFLSLVMTMTKRWEGPTKYLLHVAELLPLALLVVKVIGRFIYPVHIYNSGKFTIEEKQLCTDGIDIADKAIKVNFAAVTIGGKTQVVPVQRPYQRPAQQVVTREQQPYVATSDACQRILEKLVNKQYTPYSASPYEALFILAKDKNVSLRGNSPFREPFVKAILEDKNNFLLDVKEFLRYLVPRMHAIDHPENFLAILQLAKAHQVVIDVKTVDPNTGGNLFRKWVGRGEVNIVKALLAIDSSLIEQTAAGLHLFTRALLQGRTAEAEVLLKAMEAAHVQQNGKDRLFYQAYKDVDTCSRSEITLCSAIVCGELRQVANNYHSKKFLQKMREKEFYHKPAEPQGASLFSYNMDVIEVEASLQGFLDSLRRNGQLLTEDAFNMLETTAWIYADETIGAIVKHRYLEKTVATLGVKSARAPQMVAVLKPKKETPASIAFSISRDCKMNLISSAFECYREKITPLARLATQEEVLAALNLIEETKYYVGDVSHQADSCCLLGSNQAGEEGIYIIDIRDELFLDYPSYHKMRELKTLLAPENYTWFDQELQRRINEARPDAELAEEQNREWARQEPDFVAAGFAYRQRPFTFTTAELTTS